MGINFWGVVHGTKAFLPHLKASGEGHVVNISSVFGLVSIPSQSAYNAAKFGVRGSPTRCAWSSRSRAARCRRTTVHPGGIKTNIAKNASMVERSVETSSARAREEPKPASKASSVTTPEKAARQILEAVEADKRRCSSAPTPTCSTCSVACPWRSTSASSAPAPAAPVGQRVGPGAETDPDPPARKSDRDQPAEPPVTS